MKKIEIDNEINNFEKTLKELRVKEDVSKSPAYDTIRCLLELISRLKIQLKRDTFFSFVEQRLNIKLSAYEKDYIVGYADEKILSKCSSITRECLISHIKLAYLGEDFMTSGGKALRIIKVPKLDTFTWNGKVLPCELLDETMNKLYENNWRYYIL